jgi:zinc transport system substrate-binding protein
MVSFKPNGRTQQGLAICALSVALMVPIMGPAHATTAPNVVVTMKPVHSLVAQVMEGVGTPGILIAGNQSPHTYALKPSDAQALNRARVVFRVSAKLEAFTDKAFKALPQRVTQVSLIDAPGLRLLPVRAGATFEKHSNGHGHSHGHSHAKTKGDATDGHIWLDPANAKAMVDHIATTLSTVDPANAATYARNASATKTRLEALDRDLESALAPSKGKPIIVLHDAFQYLETRYGLNVVGSVQLSPEVPPSGKRLTEVRGKLTSLGATCIFREPGVGEKVVGTVVAGTTAKVGTVDPEATALDAGPGLYADLMRGLARSIAGCASGTS